MNYYGTGDIQGQYICRASQIKSNTVLYEFKSDMYDNV
jgi:hypothetical protein